MIKTLKEYIESVQEEDEQATARGQLADINYVADFLRFRPTTKKDLTYNQFPEQITQDNINKMPALSYGQSNESFLLETRTADGLETTKQVNVGDYIISGPSKEKYNIGGREKLLKNYPIDAGNGARRPDTKAVRMVAQFRGQFTVKFTAPWGESMILKPYDYLVKEGPGQYYRIAEFEYKQTYNEPGK